jgi:ribosomal protein L11 methyltransferase
MVPAGQIQFFAYFENSNQANEVREQISQTIPRALVEIQQVPQENWSETWKQQVHGVRVGRIWVGPPWESPGQAPVPIVIEPGMAFGTGDHPTTCLCLQALEQVLDKKPQSSVLDVGTGSGVLAIAAKKLGAGKVVGIDIDPIAVRIAKENAQKNGIDDLELTQKPVERIQGQFDVILANLYSSVLCQLAPRLASRLQKEGELFATGILLSQADQVQVALEREGLELQGKAVNEEWVLLGFKVSK